MNCKLINKETGEPKLFFKNEAGDTFSTLREVYRNSSNSYTVGVFKSDTEFQQLAKIPRQSIDNLGGKLEELIADGTLKTKTVNNEQVFEVSKGMTSIQHGENLAFIQEMLDVEVGRNGYELQGNNIKLRTKIDIPNFDDFTKLSEEFGEDTATTLYISENLRHPENNKKVDTQLSKDDLRFGLENVLQKMGFSTTSISNYIENYRLKNQVEPSAEALIDTVNKVVAFKNGEITLDALTEEVAHLIVEGTNNAPLLEDIVKTDFFKKHEAHYREIYTRQNPELTEGGIETLVRKEALGKFLADHLMNNTAPKNTLEDGLLTKLINLIRTLFENIFISDNVSRELREYAQEIEKHIYNDTLDLDISDSNVVMYKSTSDDMQNQIFYTSVIDSLIKKIEKINKGFSTLDVNNLDSEGAKLVAFELVRVISNEARGLRNVIEQKSKIDEPLTQNEIDKINILTEEIEPFLTKVQSTFENKLGPNKKEIRAMDSQVRSIVEDMFELKKARENAEETLAEKVFEKLIKKLSNDGLNKDIENYIREKISAVQRDHSYIFNYFAPFVLSSNIYAQGVGHILTNMYNLAHIDANKTISKFLPKISILKSEKFIKGNYLLSGVDYNRKDKAYKEYIYNFFKNGDFNKFLKDDTGKDIPLEDFDITTIREEMTTLDKLQMDYALLFDRKNSGKVLGPLTDYEKQQLEMLEQVFGVTTFEEMTQVSGLFLHLLDKKTFRNKISQINKNYDPSDPSYVEEMNIVKAEQRAQRDIFDSEKDVVDIVENVDVSEIGLYRKMIKDGLEITQSVERPDDTYTLWKQSNSKKGSFWVKQTDSSIPNSKIIAALKEAEYYSNPPKGKEGIRMEALEVEFKKFQKTLSPKLTEKQRRVKEANWLMANLNFSFSEEAQESLNRESLYESIEESEFPNDSVKLKLKHIDEKIKALSMRRRIILNKSAHFKSFNEYDPSRLSITEKQQLDRIEEKTNNLRREFFKVLEENGMSIERAESEIESNPNAAFREHFASEMGRPYENTGTENFYKDVREFFLSIASDSAKSEFFAYEKAYRQKRLSEGQQERLKRLKKDHHYNEMHGLIESLLPSYYKRLDLRDSDYNDFIVSLKNGEVPVQDVIDAIQGRPSTILIPLDMVANPAARFEYIDTTKLTQEELVEQYLEETDSDKRVQILRDIEALDDMNALYKSKDFKEFMSEEELEAYLSLMEMNLLSMKKHGTAKNKNIFEKPYYPESQFEKVENLLARKQKLKQVRDGILRTVSYRPDEIENAYQETRGLNAIPKYGYFKIPDTEVSRDLVSIYGRRYADAALYEQRNNAYSEVNALAQHLKTKSFKNGKRAEDTRIMTGIQEMIAQDIYGKRSQEHYEVNILGHKIDGAKIMLKLRGFISSMGIGLSPIVALTAYPTGKFIEYMMRVGGGDFHKGSHFRASNEYKKIIGGTIKDIGDLEGNSKIESILRYAGIHSITERIEGAKYGKAKAFTSGKVMFSFLSAASIPVQSKIALSVIMDYRVIKSDNPKYNNTVMNFKEFTAYKKVVEGVTDTDAIYEEFESYKNESLYDKIDESSEDLVSLEELNMTEEQKVELHAKVIANVLELQNKILAQMSPGSNVLAKNHPLLSFLFTYRSWLTNASLWSFAGIGDRLGSKVYLNYDEEGNKLNNVGKLYERRFNSQMGNFQLGSLPAVREYISNVIELYKDEGLNSLIEAYKGSDEVGKKALKETMFAQIGILTLVGIAALMTDFADDEENKDNIPLQLLTFIAVRSVNETFSATGLAGVGPANEILNVVEQPVVISRSLKSIVELGKLSKLSESMKSGPYKGMNKYLVDAYRLLAIKNLEAITSGQTLAKKRQSYLYFNDRENVVSPLTLLKFLTDGE